MKTLNKSIISAMLFVAMIFVSHTAKSQIFDKGYIDVDWQFNMPINTGFADKATGWGMSFDGGYYVTDNIGVGAFITYSTNNEYIGRQTMMLTETSALTTDQQHSIFQLPFGVSARYRFLPDAIVKPYVALKLGTEYSKVATYYNSFTTLDKSWGFYLCPEVGTTIYFTSSQSVGLHLALYYNYATNKSDVLVYHLKGINNTGFRLGLSF